MAAHIAAAGRCVSAVCRCNPILAADPAPARCLLQVQRMQPRVLMQAQAKDALFRHRPRIAPSLTPSRHLRLCPYRRPCACSNRASIACINSQRHHEDHMEGQQHSEHTACTMAMVTDRWLDLSRSAPSCVLCCRVKLLHMNPLSPSVSLSQSSSVLTSALSVSREHVAVSVLLNLVARGSDNIADGGCTTLHIATGSASAHTQKAQQTSQTTRGRSINMLFFFVRILMLLCCSRCQFTPSPLQQLEQQSWL